MASGLDVEDVDVAVAEVCAVGAVGDAEHAGEGGWDVEELAVGWAAPELHVHG
ncbi:hypothetical protein Aglo03_26120 [Actinokineospora globicatena]|uniref:Uncharacterized protein n=1 Tax=Actinokineospora globicatena TaxID=103729 RepID=A0A9W6QKN8_9PSEU|nr:hypothetical protein Aglo03_26120 [Actinokineospora globicatena]